MMFFSESGVLMVLILVLSLTVKIFSTQSDGADFGAQSDGVDFGAQSDGAAFSAQSDGADFGAQSDGADFFLSLMVLIFLLSSV